MLNTRFGRGSIRGDGSKGGMGGKGEGKLPTGMDHDKGPLHHGIWDLVVQSTGRDRSTGLGR